MTTTLPQAAYTSAAVLAYERDRVFERSWVALGRVAELARPMSQSGHTVGSQPLLAVSDEGTLRVFFNVCRHRGHELVRAGTEKKARLLRCPYHGWLYGLDGSLHRAFGVSEEALRQVADGLKPVRSVEWEGWVFVDCSGTAADFPDHLGALAELVPAWAPGGLTVAATRSYTVAANWKVLVENYHECYHCPSIHPQLCRVSPPGSGRSLPGAGAFVGGPMDLAPGAETMTLTGRSAGGPIPGLPTGLARQVYYLQLWPNLLISLHPDYVLTHRLSPLAPDRTAVECQWLFPAGADPANAVEFWDQTNTQDWTACESVQRGIGSRAYEPGPLAEQESDVARFIAMVRDVYAEGGLDL